MARTMAVRSIASIARPNGDEICSRLAIRRMPVEVLAPAPCMSAGLKNTASPLRSGTCTWWAAKWSMNSC